MSDQGEVERARFNPGVPTTPAAGGTPVRSRPLVPSLPDVDPTAFWFDGQGVRDGVSGWTWMDRAQAAEYAASALHALTLFDAEAADHTHDAERDPELDVVDELLAAACDDELARNGFSSALDRLCKLREDIRCARGGPKGGDHTHDDEDGQSAAEARVVAEAQVVCTALAAAQAQPLTLALVAIAALDAYRARNDQEEAGQ